MNGGMMTCGPLHDTETRRGPTSSRRAADWAERPRTLSVAGESPHTITLAELDLNLKFRRGGPAGPD
eukprot:2606440-Rhodomonas_salina.1